MAEEHRKELREVLVKLDTPIVVGDDFAHYVFNIYEDKILNADDSVVETRRIQEPRIFWNKTAADLIDDYTQQMSETTVDRVEILNSFITQLENGE